VAYHQDEWAVLQEFVAQYQNAYQVRLMDANEVVGLSPGVKREGLLGALHSSTEATVYSREAIRQIPAFLSEKFGVEFRMGQAVTAIEMPYVKTPRETWQIDQVYVCSGVDFETLYPSYFQQSHLTKCKLQMMRAVPRQPIELGPSLCAGLTLRHYEAFRNCPSLSQVAARYDAVAPQYKEHGVHVLVSQNAMGELIIGDSHHYGRTHEPFDSEYVNELITGYLSTFFHTASLNVVERWHGVYPKYSGGTHLVVHPEKGVTIVNGLGGAGMTLSFGLAEEIVGKG
jgi:FAD dependent oxidoreductase TIGR03364